jgi:hypothetical protein
MVLDTLNTTSTPEKQEDMQYLIIHTNPKSPKAEAGFHTQREK